jgi:hypothetical protein
MSDHGDQFEAIADRHENVGDHQIDVLGLQDLAGGAPVVAG